MAEVGFKNLMVYTWGDPQGDHIEITEYAGEMYSLCGTAGGCDIHDENHEDFCFRSKDELITFAREHQIVGLICQMQGFGHLIEIQREWTSEGF